MSLKSKAWTVTATMAVVETLKDQLGVCRWNHTLSSLHHHSRTRLKSLAQDAKKLSASATRSASVGMANKVRETERSNKSEESMRTVMQLSCWLPG